MPAAEPIPPQLPHRVISVDALRGFDMFWIMGGDLIVRSLPKIHDSPFTRQLAAQMDHCEWAGFHFYDLIFPMFVFIVGVSLVFSVTRMVERDGRAAAIKRIVIRSVILFLLGYWALMTFVPVPGLGAPSLAEPGKNLAHYIDDLYMPGRRFEGTLLSTLAAVANCLLGIFAGLLLKNQSIPDQKKVYWLVGS